MVFSPHSDCQHRFFFYLFSFASTTLIFFVILSTGVILPVHCVCGIHYAAILHAGRHHRQCPDFSLAHHCAECLPVHHSWSHGTSSVAGKMINIVVDKYWLDHSGRNRPIIASVTDRFSVVFDFGIQNLFKCCCCISTVVISFSYRNTTEIKLFYTKHNLS